MVQLQTLPLLLLRPKRILLLQNPFASLGELAFVCLFLSLFLFCSSSSADLYDEIGADNFVIYFDDSAAFSAKLSSAQKDVNLYYSVDEIEAVADAYPDVDFEFISFYGAPSFNNAGEMTFNAIGAKNTTVYTFDGETLTPLDTTYDSTYGTVTAKGIKKLTTFVVADQVLEVEEEEEEPEEPADKTPAVEEQNPNTGAC